MDYHTEKLKQRDAKKPQALRHICIMYSIGTSAEDNCSIIARALFFYYRIFR